MTPPKQKKKENEDQYRIFSKDGLNIKDMEIEDDCACTDGRFQSILLAPPKDQETPTRDPK